MKKIICSALLGLTVCGSAFAISVIDRKKFCENAEGFVWVEKTQACIPENPCTATVDSIKETYCIDASQVKIAEPIVFQAYIENVLKDKVASNKQLEKSSDNLFMAYYTVDGNYYVFSYKENAKVKYASMLKTQKSIAWAMGARSGSASIGAFNGWIEIFLPENNAPADVQKSKNEKKCAEATDIAIYLVKGSCSHELIWNNKCKITCDYNSDLKEEEE